MKITQVMFIVGALLFGLVLGNWSVQSDLRKARLDVTDLKKQLAARGSRNNGLQGITSMLRVPEPVRAKTADAPKHQHRGPFGHDAGSTDTALETDMPPQPANASPEVMREQMRTAAELWKTRSALARNSFLSNLAATPEQTQAIDQAIANMNQQLGDKIKQWAEFLKLQPEVSPETGVRMMNDLSSTLVGSYDELDRTLSPDWRDKAGKEFQVFDFINPDVALPLTDVKFDLSHMRRPMQGKP